MHHMVNIAVTAARKAGNIIVRYLDQLDKIGVSEKGYNDFVTGVDKQAEQEIIDTIRKVYPQHNIIGEESGEITGENSGEEEHTWIIDPLDGTMNYIHGFPHFAVSIGCKLNGKIEHGVIYDPIRQELFTATRGNGAYLNERRIRVSEQKKLQRSLVGTGFPFRDRHHLKYYMNMFQAIYPEVSGMRRAGSAALDLAYVAAGRFDGFWELGLKEWDMAAGVLLIKEAGGLVGDLHGEESYLETGNIVAGNPKIFKALLQIIQTCLRD